MQEVITYPFDLALPDLSSSMRMFNVVPVVVCKLSDRRIDKTHWHDFLQIWYTVSGSYILYMNGVPHIQQPGSAVLIFPYMQHSIDSSQCDLSQTQVIRISVKKDFLETFGVPYLSHTYNTAYFEHKQLFPSLSFTADEKQQADKICLDLLAESEKQTGIQSYHLLKLVTQFLSLCATHSSQFVSDKTLQAIREKNACIDEAMHFMVCNSANRISLEDVTGVAMMSRSSFMNSFHTTVGQTYHAYLRALRMKKAVHMLLRTKKSISQIAEEAGFYDHCHFRKVCVEMYGATPLEVRKKMSQWTRDYGDPLFQDAMVKYRWALTFERSIESHQCAMSFY